jgi:elongation factor 4
MLLFLARTRSRLLTTKTSASASGLLSRRWSAFPEAISLLASNQLQIPPSHIRNFIITAHIDHGKSTLSDRLLELTGTIAPAQKDGGKNKQVLDKLQVERERGITVKAQACSMFVKYGPDDEVYQLNLIDTPGHADFNYEVSRSLAACQGALLLVDAAQGVQAQTLANLYLCLEAKLAVLPVLNKIDLPTADVERSMLQVCGELDFDPDRVLKVSAKTGRGVADIIPDVIDYIPAPAAAGSSSPAPLRALLFDSWFQEYKGVCILIAVVEGRLKRGDKISLAHVPGSTYEVAQAGLMFPEPVDVGALTTGQVGFVLANIKSTRDARVGDTVFMKGSPVEPLPGFKPILHMVYSGVYPSESDKFEELQSSLDRLLLNDASVLVTKEISSALGHGFRCGFLGLLHSEVFFMRLQQEQNMAVIVTAPMVTYKLVRDGVETSIDNPAAFPDSIAPGMAVLEPMVLATLTCPAARCGKVLELCQAHRGQHVDMTTNLSGDQMTIRYRLPFSEIITDFHDSLKSATSGYSTLDYEHVGFEASDLVKLSISVNNQPVDALATVVHSTRAQSIGRRMCEKLKQHISRELFQVDIRAICKGKPIASERLSALRRDVTAKCYGGDVSRKNKLLDRQKEGKKKMKSIGGVEIPHEAFLEVLKTR